MSAERNRIAKKVTKNMLDSIILGMALDEGKIYGYGVISKIRKDYNVYFGTSTIYPLLEKLEKDGCLESNWEFGGKRPRKSYTATTKAEIIYKAWLDQIRTMPILNSAESAEFMVNMGNDVQARQRLRKSTR